jgi:hypothetical protein
LVFRADEMEVIQQTTEGRIEFHNRCWKSVYDEGTPGIVAAALI